MKQSVKDANAAAREKAIIEDLESQLASMHEKQVASLNGSKEHVLAQLTRASEKYLTVNGYMQARETVKQALFGETLDQAESLARSLAGDISELAVQLHDKVAAIDIMELDDSILDDLYDKDFVSKPHGVEDVAYQLLVMNMLQNIGPILDDHAQFRARALEEIAATEEELAKHKPAAKLKSVKGGKK